MMKAALVELSQIPGVGPSIARDLYSLGIREIAELRGRDPQALYSELCRETGQHVDRCVLYVFRCAVYFASDSKHDPELLKWWNWKDGTKAAAEMVCQIHQNQIKTRNSHSRPGPRPTNPSRSRYRTSSIP